MAKITQTEDELIVARIRSEVEKLVGLLKQAKVAGITVYINDSLSMWNGIAAVTAEKRINL